MISGLQNAGLLTEEESDVEFLQKPFSATSLTATIRRVLDDG